MALNSWTGAWNEVQVGLAIEAASGAVDEYAALMVRGLSCDHIAISVAIVLRHDGGAVAPIDGV
jgi:hypothetical protein